MIKDWKVFLDESITELKTISQNKNMLFNLTDQGLIKVHGEDAESFLQNQLSNDVRNVNESTHQTSAWCSPKGRIIASFRIFKREDAYFLSVSADLIEPIIKKLRMYVMMSKVTIEDASAELVHFAYSGKQLINAPTKPEQTLQSEGLSILNISGNDSSRFEIFGTIDDAKKLWNELATTAEPTNNDAWNYLNILAGFPTITQASSEAWIPQMVNFIAIGGVDFKKGCYPGQEVVARLNYLGKTKRRMYRLEIDTSQLPNTGDSISTDEDKDAGKILNAAINPEGKVEVLAILKIAQADSSLQLSENASASIDVLDLPYSLDS